MMKRLISLGCNLGHKDNDGHTPLHDCLQQVKIPILIHLSFFNLFLFFSSPFTFTYLYSLPQQVFFSSFTSLHYLPQYVFSSPFTLFCSLPSILVHPIWHSSFHQSLLLLSITGSHSKSENILFVIFNVSYFIIILATFQHKLIKTKDVLDHINVENIIEQGKHHISSIL